MLLYNKLLQYWQRKAASLLPPILDNFGARRIFLIAYTFGLGDDSKFASFRGGRGFNLTWFFGSNWVHALNDISSGSGVLLCLCIAVLLRDSLGCKDRCANISFLTYLLTHGAERWLGLPVFRRPCRGEVSTSAIVQNGVQDRDNGRVRSPRLQRRHGVVHCLPRRRSTISDLSTSGLLLVPIQI